MLKYFALCAVAFVTFEQPAAAAPTPDVGYVNMTKAIRDTAEGKKAFAEIEAFTKERQAEINAAVSSAQAAAAKCSSLAGAAKKTCDAAAEKASADLNEMVRKTNAAVSQRQQAVDARVGTRAARILPKIAAAHKVTLIQPANSALYIAPKADYTAELVKRYDAGEGKTDEDLADELREKNAALEREKAAETKRAADLEAKVAALEKAAAKPASGKN